MVWQSSTECLCRVPDAFASVVIKISQMLVGKLITWDHHDLQGRGWSDN
jgi:hypothetical protein